MGKLPNDNYKFSAIKLSAAAYARYGLVVDVTCIIDTINRFVISKSVGDLYLYLHDQELFSIEELIICNNYCMLLW